MLPETQLQKGGAARLRCMMRMLGHSSLTAARSGVSTGVNTAVAPLSAYKRAANVKRQIEFTLTRVVKCLSTDNNEVPVNKRQGGTVMTDQLYGYLLSHTPEHEAHKWLRKETAKQFPVGARMQVSPEQAQFLAWLVKATHSKNALELGVFTGYSALSVALALPSDGKLTACDRDARPLVLARQAFQMAGVADKVKILQQPALEVLQHMLQQPNAQDSLDFAFIDADKRAYGKYYELCLQLVQPGGMIVLDNVLWYGKVADPEVTDKRTTALRELNKALLHDKRILLSIVPVGDGMALCLKQ